MHKPVLLEEVMGAMQLSSGQTILDCTLGEGGHARRILDAIAPDGRFLGMDKDGQALGALKNRLAPYGDRVATRQGDFRTLDAFLEDAGVGQVDGILMDLGVRSSQLEDGKRGFSFRQVGPLDMRMDTTRGITAGEIVNRWPAEDLARILRDYGEIRGARGIARRIVRARPVQDTLELAAIGVPGARARGMHPATQVFQAVRIAVNDELGALREALPKALDKLKTGGVLCVISFHSLEDRIVKRFMARAAARCICPNSSPVCRCGGKPLMELCTRKPVRPSEQEIAENPRSRSARLRVAKKLPSAEGYRQRFKGGIDGQE